MCDESSSPAISDRVKVSDRAKPLAVVGIGASAGGIDALEQFFSTVPNDTGMAYVILQHVDPAARDVLREVLSKFTSLPVIELDAHRAQQSLRCAFPLNDRVYRRSTCQRQVRRCASSRCWVGEFP